MLLCYTLLIFYLYRNFPPVLSAIEYDKTPSTVNLNELAAEAPSTFKLPQRHKKTHNIPVAQIQFKAYGSSHLDFFVDFAQRVAYHLGMPISGPVMLPTRHEKFTVLKSPFVHKKSQEVFERRTHSRLIKIFDSNPDVVDRLVDYLTKHAMNGVRMRVENISYKNLDFGNDLLQIGYDTQPNILKSQDETIADTAKEIEEKIKFEIGQQQQSSSNEQTSEALENTKDAAHNLSTNEQNQ